MKTSIFFLFLIAFIGVLTAAVIIDRPMAQSVGDRIVLSWKTDDESGVLRFDILRRQATQSNYKLIGSIKQLKGNNSSYEYIDEGAFKTAGGVYVYVVRVVFNNGTTADSQPTTVSHLSSTYKRTWGSIKAMFR